jgi:general secretion pathway protein I
MVAIAILALSLSAIFSTEAGAARMAHRSRKMGIASLLARCKMGEIEEQVAIEGLPALFDSGSDDCCEEAEVDGYSCDWEIHPVVLPEGMFGTDDDPLGDPGAGTTDPATGTTGEPAGLFGDLSQTQPQDLLSGGANLGAIASIALQHVYPVLKPSFESQIRRATVTVRWKEGSTDHDFDVTQYLVSENPVQVLGDDAPGGGSVTGTGTVAPAGN